VPSIERPGTSTEATSDTDTFLKINSYRIDYSTLDPTAPVLNSREFFTQLWDGLVAPEEAQERSDIMLVSLATVAEFNEKVAAGAIPTDSVPEYVAKYTFYVENVPFGEEQTVEFSVSFSFGNFIPNS